MNLQEYCDSLPKDKIIDLAIRLAKAGLAVWDKYTADNPLTYTDSIVAMHHKVDKAILSDTLTDIETYTSSGKLARILGSKDLLAGRLLEFRDPIVSLQDADWELPYEVECIFYSVYNLLRAVTGEKQTAFDDESIIYVAINQAIDAMDTAKLKTEEEIRSILYGN
ncbi:MAG: hypothetical protein WCL06_06870 [Bacteroidota bacterium]